MAVVTICSDFGAQKNKVSHCFHSFPIYLPWSDGTRCHDLSFLNVELRLLSSKPTFSLSTFTFIKRLFSSSSLSAMVVSSAYLRLLIFLPAILIPACVSSSPWTVWKGKRTRYHYKPTGLVENDMKIPSLGEDKAPLKFLNKRMISGLQVPLVIFSDNSFSLVF